MSFLIFILAVAALLVAFKALRASRPRRGQPTPAERIAGLEERVRDLLYRVWTLEQERGGAPPQPEAPPAPAPTAVVPTELVPSAHEPLPSPAWSAAAAAAESAAVHAAAPPPAPAPRLDLEQRIGARWTTWVGVIAILFAASFFVKWAIENEIGR